MQKVKERAQNTQERPRCKNQNVTSTVSEEYATNMPKLTSVAGATQRERDFEVVPKTVGNKAMAMEPLGQTWTFSSATQLGTRMAHSKMCPSSIYCLCFQWFFSMGYPFYDLLYFLL